MDGIIRRNPAITNTRDPQGGYGIQPGEDEWLRSRLDPSARGRKAEGRPLNECIYLDCEVELLGPLDLDWTRVRE